MKEKVDVLWTNKYQAIVNSGDIEVGSIFKKDGKYTLSDTKDNIIVIDSNYIIIQNHFSKLVSAKTKSRKIDIASIDELTEVISNNDNVLVYFKVDWSSPCRTATDYVDVLISNYDDIVVAVVDTDTNNNMVSERFMLRSVPTFYKYNKGDKVGKSVGVCSVAELLEDMAVAIKTPDALKTDTTYPGVELNTLVVDLLSGEDTDGVEFVRNTLSNIFDLLNTDIGKEELKSGLMSYVNDKNKILKCIS